jgi:hypothetical protein
MKHCIHFVGFRDPQRFQNAQRVFGPPSFVHVHLDNRAMADMAPGDTVVFATTTKHPVQRFVPWSFDDSNTTPGDPAAAERKAMRGDK